MIDANAEQNWETWMVQARRFADAGHLGEAVARATLVFDSIQQKCANEDDTRRRRQLEHKLQEVEWERSHWRQQYDEERRQIETRRMAKVHDAGEEMKWEIPTFD